MLAIKSIGAPLSGSTWSMGAEYMQRIDKSDAVRLLDPYPLPRMGYETDARVKVRPGFFAGRDVLTVQNISGHFYAACTSARISEWPGLFGVTIEGVQA